MGAGSRQSCHRRTPTRQLTSLKKGPRGSALCGTVWQCCCHGVLLEHDPSFASLADGAGQQPLHIAAARRDRDTPEVVALLLAAGQTPLDTAPRYRFMDGSARYAVTAFEIAAVEGHTDVLDCMLAYTGPQPVTAKVAVRAAVINAAVMERTASWGQSMRHAKLPVMRKLIAEAAQRDRAAAVAAMQAHLPHDGPCSALIDAYVRTSASVAECDAAKSGLQQLLVTFSAAIKGRQ